jgi:hypothetical protein
MESGTHEELLLQGGLYYRLYAMTYASLRRDKTGEDVKRALGWVEIVGHHCRSSAASTRSLGTAIPFPCIA